MRSWRRKQPAMAPLALGLRSSGPMEFWHQPLSVWQSILLPTGADAAARMLILFMMVMREPLGKVLHFYTEKTLLVPTFRALMWAILFFSNCSRSTGNNLDICSDELR